MPDKLLSVVVPAHNAEWHLASCLRALLATRLPRDAWELIVVDDASTDSTGKIASEYADIVFRAGDGARGPSWARNRGAEQASGEIIAFVDADVSVHPDALRIATDSLSADPGLVAVFGSYDDTPSDPSLVSRYRNLLHHYTHQQNAGRAASFWSGCGAVRASVFRAAGGFDEIRFAKPQIEDIELGYRLRRLGGILLEPSMQGTHHKRWSIASMMRTDFHDRAVPWVRLLLTAERAPASTPSLGSKAMLSTAAAGVAAASIVAAAGGLGMPASIGAVVSLFLFVAINSGFYRWLNSRGGPSLVLTAIPLHFAHQLLSALAVPVGATSFLLGDDGRPGAVRGSAREVTGTRFIPLAFGEIGARVIAFAATAWLARRLGASGFGQIAFATAVVAHFGTSLVQSAADLGVQDVARKPDHAREIASAGVALRLIVAVAAIIGIALVTSLLGLDPERRTITLLYAVSIIPLALDTSWVFKGVGRTGVAAASLMIAQASSLVLVLALVSSPDHVRRVPLIQMAGELLASAVLLVLLMRGRWVRPDFSLVRAMARRSSLFVVSRVLRTIVVSLGIVILGLLVSSQEVGWYSAAYRIVFFVSAIIYAAHVSFLPEIARSASDPRALSGILSRAIALALAVTIPFVVGGILIAPALMDRIFGNEYQNGAVALQLLLVSLVLFAIYGATRNVFLTLHRPGLDTFNIACGVVANVTLNLVLIPRYGIEGAAVATVAGEAVMLAMAFAGLMKLGIRPRLQESTPAMLAGMALGGALLVVPAPRPLLLSVLGGGTVYVVALASATILARRRFIALSAGRN